MIMWLTNVNTILVGTNYKCAMKNLNMYLQKPLLNSLSIFHGGKTLTIIILLITIIIHSYYVPPWKCFVSKGLAAPCGNTTSRGLSLGRTVWQHYLKGVESWLHRVSTLPRRGWVLAESCGNTASKGLYLGRIVWQHCTQGLASWPYRVATLHSRTCVLAAPCGTLPLWAASVPRRVATLPLRAYVCAAPCGNTASKGLCLGRTVWQHCL